MPKKAKVVRRVTPKQIARDAKTTMHMLLRELNKGLKELGYKLVAPIEIQKL